eukprot:756356-Hanusia_phi.AAC.3
MPGGHGAARHCTGRARRAALRPQHFAGPWYRAAAIRWHCSLLHQSWALTRPAPQTCDTDRARRARDSVTRACGQAGGPGRGPGAGLGVAGTTVRHPVAHCLNFGNRAGH